MHYISVFPDITKAADFWWKMLYSAELMRCVMWFIYLFGTSLDKV